MVVSMVSGKIKWSEWIFLKEDLSSSHSIEQGSFYVITFFIHEFFKSVIFFFTHKCNISMLGRKMYETIIKLTFSTACICSFHPCLVQSASKQRVSEMLL